MNFHEKKTLHHLLLRSTQQVKIASAFKIHGHAV
jgi:hypothetical protein